MTLFDEAPNLRALYSRAPRLFQFLLRLCLVSCLLTCHINVWAQDDQDTDVVRVRTDLVTAPAFVTESHGLRVMNLMASDFELRDNGHVVKIEYFVTGTERVALVFVLDASGSVREVITRQREVALSLLSRFGRTSEVEVIRFAEKAEVVAPFSNDSSDASRAFELPAIMNRRTAIFDAVATAVRAFDSRRNDAAERRIVVLISDGLDTVSVTRFGDVIDSARDRGVSVYSIQIPLFVPRDGRLRPRPASKGFRELAEKSGGRFFMAGDAKTALADKASYDLSPIFQVIEDDLRGQYVLGYYPEAETQDGRFHRIDLKLTSTDKRKLRVHLLRDGYTSTK